MIAMVEIKEAVEKYARTGDKEWLWQLVARLTAAVAAYDALWPALVESEKQMRLEAGWWKAELYAARFPDGLCDYTAGGKLWRYDGHEYVSFPADYVPGWKQP